MNQELSGGIRILLILGTIFFPGPLLGIILGIIWMSDQNASIEKKQFGKTLLIIGLIIPFLGCICYAVFLGGMIGLGNM